MHVFIGSLGPDMGDYTTLMARDGHEFRAWLTPPPGKPRGAIVVLQEIFGVNSHIRAVTDGFAAEGYVAIAPSLFDRVRKGIEVRVLGAVGKRAKVFRADTLKSLRLHARVIIRDGREVFFGSQSLRTAELDSRREVGIIVKDPKIVKGISEVFEKDWSETKVAKAEQDEEQPAGAITATA